MAKFDIKTVKPKFVVTTSPENKIDVVVNKPIIETKLSKSFFKLKNTGGPKGVKGDKGEPGQDSTIEVVSTTTGAAGTNASVVNQGTASAAQLAFTIPRGDKGDKGNDGAAGYSPTATVSKSGDTATITITDKNGTTTASISDGQDGAAGAPGQAATIAVDSTSTLPAGSSATVTNVGTSSAALLAFGIPKGDTGAAGQDGDAATIQVGQVETLQPNQPAYVQNVGTSSAAIFNIGIPKGDKGDSGSGSGDMTASVYDPNGTVAAAGGIPDYVDSNGGKIDTIKVNGTTQTITNKTVDLSVPTKTSDIANDSGYITSASLPTKTSDLTNDSGYITSASLPTKTSDLTNDSGFITSADLPTKTSDLQNDGADGTSTYVEADDLATVATSGSYSDLSNKPTIPAAQVNSDWNANSGVAEILNKPTLAAVATSGSYNDLSNTPTIPAAQVNSDWDAASGVAQILNKPSLATVATTGAYSDLSGKPTIPTVNNATLTIQKNGTNVATFTANASSNVTANISVPTQFSNLSGTVSSSQIADKAVTIAKLADLSYGTGTVNSTYFSSGRVQWVKHARMVTVTMSDLTLKTAPPNSTNATNAVSGLPTSASWKQNDVINLTVYGGTTKPLTLRMDGNKTALSFHYTSGTPTGTYNGQFTYPAA